MTSDTSSNTPTKHVEIGRGDKRSPIVSQVFAAAKRQGLQVFFQAGSLWAAPSDAGAVSALWSETTARVQQSEARRADILAMLPRR